MTERTPVANLLIVGVKKAGTSSLFEYLSQHPDICPSSVKETGYFSTLLRDNGSLLPPEYYAGFFTAWRGERYRLDATPDYFYGGSRVIQAIAHTVPDPRLIVTLRNPVTRLWSHYQMKRREGSHAVEGLTFEEYIRRCEEIGVDGSVEARGYAALAHGRYLDFMGEWFDAFGDHFRVVFLESWSTRPQATMRDLAKWLGIDDQIVNSFDYSVTNRAMHYRAPRTARAARMVYKPIVHVLHRHPRRQRLLHAVSYLRGVHDVLNRQRPMKELGPGLGMDTRRYLDDVYRDANRRLGLELVRRGYRDLPPWLSQTVAEVT